MFPKSRIDRFILPFTAVLGMLYYAFLITNGTFNFFAHEAYGFVYNDMLLKLLRGRFDIEAAHIGVEGFYVDGKAYTYFGIAPALLRLPFLPFADLETVQVSRPIVWALATASALIAQGMTLRICRGLQTSPPSTGLRLMMFLLVVMIWFASPSVLLSANATVYHEPIAVAYLLTLAFMAVVLRCAADDTPIERYPLILLAILAGIAVHARPHIAIALYACVVAYCAIAYWTRFQRAWVVGEGGPGGAVFRTARAPGGSDPDPTAVRCRLSCGQLVPMG
ncbi:MAG: hypothetical protein WCH04_21110 [Gammaproteobacteria bacterium]